MRRVLQSPELIVHLLNEELSPADQAVWIMRCGWMCTVDAETGETTPLTDFVLDPAACDCDPCLAAPRSVPTQKTRRRVLAGG